MKYKKRIVIITIVITSVIIISFNILKFSTKPVVKILHDLEVVIGQEVDFTDGILIIYDSSKYKDDTLSFEYDETNLDLEVAGLYLLNYKLLHNDTQELLEFKRSVVVNTQAYFDKVHEINGIKSYGDKYILNATYNNLEIPNNMIDSVDKIMLGENSNLISVYDAKTLDLVDVEITIVAPLVCGYNCYLGFSINDSSSSIKPEIIIYYDFVQNKSIYKTINPVIDDELYLEGESLPYDELIVTLDNDIKIKVDADEYGYFALDLSSYDMSSGQNIKIGSLEEKEYLCNIKSSKIVAEVEVDVISSTDDELESDIIYED